MSTATQTAPAAPAKSGWIVGAWQDWLLVIATPAILLPLFAFAKDLAHVHTLTAFATILALGHHLPGMMRAYGDKALFRRFRTRFILAPIFLVTASVTFAMNGMHTVLMLAFLWGAWHWCMQSYGFMRIYDGKKKSVDRVTANLDRAMCIAWFGFALFLSPRPFYDVILHYHKSGGVLPPSGLLIAFRQVWLAGTVIVTGWFLFNLVKHYRAGHPPSPIKLVLMVVTFTYYWYTLALVPNGLVAYALFEMYHDIQYLTIVWLFNRRRAATDEQAGGFTRYLFRQRGGLMLLYVGLCLAYGSFDYGARMMENQAFRDIALALVVASAMLHFYFDGFIWKLREASTGGALGLDTSKARARTFKLSPPLRHAMFWSLFIVPMVIFGKLESRGEADRAGQVRAMAALMPENPAAQAALCGILVEFNRFDEAAIACRKAEDMDPDESSVLHNLGNVAMAEGNFANAEDYFKRGIAANPERAQGYIGMATVQAQRGELDAAIKNFERGVKLDPRNAIAHFNLGRARYMLRDYQAALVSYARARELDPGLEDLPVSIGSTLMRLERFEEARAEFVTLVKENPQDLYALRNLVDCLLQMKKDAEAIALLESGVQRMPRNPELMLELARQYRRAGKLQQALKKYHAVTQLAPKDARPWLESGLIRLKAQDYEAAIKLFAGAATVDPGRPEPHHYMGTIRTLQERYDDALPHFRKALAIDPDFESSRRTMNDILKKKENP